MFTGRVTFALCKSRCLHPAAELCPHYSVATGKASLGSFWSFLWSSLSHAELNCTAVWGLYCDLYETACLNIGNYTYATLQRVTLV